MDQAAKASQKTTGSVSMMIAEANAAIAEQLTLQVEEASRRMSNENVEAVHEKYSKGSKVGIKMNVFKQALSEIRQEFVQVTDYEVERYFIEMDVENNKALDLDHFRRAVQKPFPIEQAVSALPLSRLIASSVPGLGSLNIEDHLEAFSKLQDDEVSAMTSAVSFELKKLLLIMVHDLRKRYEVSKAGDGNDATAEISTVFSGGKMEDAVGEFLTHCISNLARRWKNYISF